MHGNFMPGDSLSVRNLCAEQVDDQGAVAGVNDFSYDFRSRYFYEIRGEDRSAGNLLLRTLGLRVPAMSGDLFIEGASLMSLDVDELSDVRARKFGYLFSSPFLLPALTVLENVAMPLFKIAQVAVPEGRLITEEVLDMIGISKWADVSVQELDALQQMLTSLARAVIHHPRILIAENVGIHLSDAAGAELLRVIRRCSQRLGPTVIATVADHVPWQNSDVSLEVRSRRVEEFLRNNPHG
jgi:ABC-type lipoprotein export system ATPase subunit